MHLSVPAELGPSSDVARSAGQQLRDLLGPAAACAMVSGVLHGFVSWMRRDLLHDLLRTWMSPDITWMAPLGYCLVFLPVVVVLAVLALFLSVWWYFIR